MNHANRTLGSLLSHDNTIIKRNAFSILKQLNKEPAYIHCVDCDKAIEIKRDNNDNIIHESCPYCSNP